MLRTRADLPDTLVGLTPMLKRTLHLSLHNPPQTILDATVTTGVRVNRRDHGTPHVVLALAICGIADTHGPSALIAGQVVQGRFAERCSPPTPYISCRSPPAASATSAMKLKKSFASQSSPNVFNADNVPTVSRIQV